MSQTTAGPKIGRLAIRVEGEFINAYYAQTETMKDARLLLSMPGSVSEIPGVRDRFIDLGRHIVGETIFEVTGVRPVWGGLERAPEHEKAGNA